MGPRAKLLLGSFVAAVLLAAACLALLVPRFDAIIEAWALRESAGDAQAARALLERHAQVWEELRELIVWAVLAGAALAVGVATFVARVWSNAVRRLLKTASTLVRVVPGTSASTGDELAGLAGSLDVVGRELERAVRTLANERNRSRAILDSMNEAVLALDDEQRITVANPAATRLLGQTTPPLGRTLLETVRAAPLQDLVREAREGEASEAEFELPGARRVLARTAPLDNGSGSVIVMHDVTELRRLETIRKDFVANVSHELRTPVSIIRANAETLQGGALEDGPRAKIFVDAMYRNAERLATLVTDLLDISRIEAGHYKLSQSPVDVHELFTETLEHFTQRAAQKRITLRLGDVPPATRVMADRGALSQILANLVDNAIKYIQEGGEVLLVAIQEGGVVRLEVQDNGPGIEPRHRPRIFERFYRVDPGRSRDMGGTGLGLAIVKHLVESMYGDVGARANEPNGTVLWLTLPAAVMVNGQPVALSG